MDDAAPLVVDLTGTLAGAYCCRLLAGGGASVLRVEPPGGHPLRRWRAGGVVPDGEDGALFGWLAGGQDAVVVDVDDPGDRSALRAWLGSADAVVWGPGPLTGVGGVGLAEVQEGAGEAVVTALTPFGTLGPWASRPATEFVLQALSGGPALRGSRRWPPMSAGGQHGEWMTGLVGAVATLIGLRRRTLGGGGGLYDVSGLEAVIMTQLFNPITMQSMQGGVSPRRALATVGDVVACADGYVGFAVVNRLQHWLDFCAMVERPDWADDRSLDAVWNRAERSDELNPVIAAWAAERTMSEIVELAGLLRVPAVAVGNGESIPAMAQMAAEGFHEPNPRTGVLQPARPYRYHPPIPGIEGPLPAPGPGAAIRQRPVPVRSPHRRSGPRDQAAAAAPLAGVRVADFTSFWAGPFLAQTLALFGAEVIHVESMSRPDGSRLMLQRPTSTPQWWEWSSYFQATNTSKKGVTIEMGTAEGRDLARRLVAQCDVVIENYSPRVMESWGLGWEEVRSRRADTVMVRMPAFGLSGPWRDRTGFAMTMEQVSGMAWLSGFPEHAPGALFGPCDPGAGLHAAIGLLGALEHRRRTGEGRLVEVPMVLGALNVAGEQVIEYSAYGTVLGREGNRSPAAAPQNCYESSERDETGSPRWVAVSVADDEQWRRLCGVVGVPGWADRLDLAHLAGRRAAHDELDAGLAAWCAGRTVDDIVDSMLTAGVPVAPVVHPWEQLGFPQLAARQFFETVDHPVAGPSRHVSYPFRLPGSAGPVHRGPAPLLGQHNDDVFGGLLGCSAAEIARLRENGVIGDQVPS
jgi:crotonobetainyl-CoA:carnitine CoA-transferase CaiB-like acyl-CoA transferase